METSIAVIIISDPVAMTHVHTKIIERTRRNSHRVKVYLIFLPTAGTGTHTNTQFPSPTSEII